MTFLTLTGIDETHEPKNAPEGEYDLCIVNAKMNEKEGRHSIMNVIEIEGEPDYANVFHYVALPGEDDEDDARQTKLLFAKRFFYQFGIDFESGGVELEQFVGSRARGKLVQREYEGNITSGLQVNRLPAEEAEAA